MTNSLPDFLDPSRVWIGIIGMGAGGAAAFNSLIQRVFIHDALYKSIGVVLIDSRPREEFGRGVAWASLQSDLFLANMRLPTMGLSPKVYERLELASEHGTYDPEKIADRSQFEMRVKIGAAMHDEFEENVRLAESKSIPVIFKHDGVDDLEVFGRGFAIRFTNEHAVFVEYCMLALGNVPRNPLRHLDGVPGFVANPWKWEDYRRDLSGKRVGVVGLGPTAVDTMLLALDEGATKVFALSRNGRLQYPRPRNRGEKPYELRHLSKRSIESHFNIRRSLHQEGLDFGALQALLIEEMGEHCKELLRIRKTLRDKSPRDMLYEGRIDADKYPEWYSILKAMDENIPFTWHCLTSEAKREYKEKLELDHMSISYGMAYRQCERLCEQLEAKKLEIGKSTAQAQARAEGGFVMHGENGQTEVDMLINCTGIGGEKPEDFTSPLVKSLHEKGWLVAHEWGGFCVDFTHGQLMKTTDGIPSIGDVYALAGSLTRGTHLLTNCLGQLFASCERTVQHIVTKIGATIPS